MAGGQQAAGLDSKEAVPLFLGLEASIHAPKPALRAGLTPKQTGTPPISPTAENFSSKSQSESVESRMEETLTMNESLPQSQDSVKTMLGNPHLAWLFGSTMASEEISGPVDDHQGPTTNASQSNLTAQVQPAESSGENEKSNTTTIATKPHQQSPAEPSGESKTFDMHSKGPAGHSGKGRRYSPSEYQVTLSDGFDPMDLFDSSDEASDSSTSELYLTDTGMEQVDAAIRDATFAFIKKWVEQTPELDVTTGLQKIPQKDLQTSDSIDTMTGKLLASIEYPDTMADWTDHDSDLLLKRNTLTSQLHIDQLKGKMQTEQESTVGSPEGQHIPSVENKSSVQSKTASAQGQTPEHMTDPETFPMTPITGRRVWGKPTQHKEDIKPEEVQQTQSMEATSFPLVEPTEKLHRVTAQQARTSTSSQPTKQPKMATTPTRSQGAWRGKRAKRSFKKRTSRKQAKSSESNVEIFRPIGAILTPVKPDGWVDSVDRTVPMITAPQTPIEEKWKDRDSDIHYESPGYAKLDMSSDTSSDMVAPIAIAPATKSLFLNNGIMAAQTSELTAQAGEKTAQTNEVTESIRRLQSLAEWQVDGSPTKPTLVLRPTQNKKNSPKVACYMRPATQADMSQVTAIYNWEVENGVQALSEKLTVSAFTNILQKIQHLKMPFIVVVKGSYPGPKVVGAEKIVGFGHVSPWLPAWCLAGGMENVGTMSVWLQVYVHPTYRDNRIGSCLIDKLTTLCVPLNDQQEDGCFFANPDDDAVYGKTSVRAYHKLYMQCLEPNEKFTRAGYFRSAGLGIAEAEDVLTSPERLRHILAKPERKNGWSLCYKEKSSHIKSRNGGVRYFLDSTVYAYDGYLQMEQDDDAVGW